MIGYVISRLSSVETKEVFFFCLPLDNQSAIKRVQRRRIVECGLESSSSLKSQLKHYHQSLRTAKKQETEATSKKSPLAGFGKENFIQGFCNSRETEKSLKREHKVGGRTETRKQSLNCLCLVV